MWLPPLKHLSTVLVPLAADEMQVSPVVPAGNSPYAAAVEGPSDSGRGGWWVRRELVRLRRARGRDVLLRLSARWLRAGRGSLRGRSRVGRV